MPTVKDIMDAMERIAPRRFAETRDRERIGLHAGDPAAAVTRVALALDATLGAMAAASDKGAEMLVVHHPRFHGGIRNLVEADPAGRRGLEIIRRGLAVFSAHTNLDAAPGGTNDCLAAAAGIVDPRVVEPLYVDRLLKLAVFVPKSHVETVRDALDRAGAGAIGNYSGCTFRTPGTGTFRCGKGTKPFQGTPGSFEEADEYRLETIFEESLREKILAAMMNAHPYEEVAYDLYSLAGGGLDGGGNSTANGGTVYGLGRAGDLAKAETVESLARRLAKRTKSTQTQFSGKAGRKVRRAAVWAGGGAPVDLLSATGAEVVVAGEIGYHDVETFGDNGVSVVTLGHGFSEELALEPLAERLGREVPGARFFVAGTGCISMRAVPCG